MSVTDRYMAKVFGFYILGLLTILVVILQMLDLLSRSDEIMAATDASMINLAIYAVLHAPQFLIKFTPFAVLMAMLLTMMQMAVSSEIIALRACGMAPIRILKPFVLVSMLVAVSHFLFAEFVGVPFQARFSAWEDSGFSNIVGRSKAVRKNIWYQFDGQFLQIGQAEWFDDRVDVSDFTLFAIGEGGLVTRKTIAASARYTDATWTLRNGRISNKGETMAQEFATMVWQTRLLPTSLLNETTTVSALPLSALQSRIGDMEAAGSAAYRERTSFYMRFSSPFSNMIMPFLGLFVGLAVPRAGKFAAYMAFGLAVGFVFFTLDNLGVAFGNLGVLPPLLATFFAPVGFLCAGVLYLIGREA